MKKLKSILSNRNTVTFIGIILIALVLYAFYKWNVNNLTSPVRIPYANQTINPRTKITSDMISYVDMPSAAIKGNVVTNVNDIVNKYTNVNTLIPAGSLIYKSQIVRQEELPDSFLIDIEDGYVPYNFDVDIKSTYGNSIYPGNYVDVYFKGIQDGKLMVGRLLENVKVLAVKDSGGRHVFEYSDSERTPSQIIFAVTPEIHLLLRKAEYINGVKIILVPNNTSLKLEDSEEEVAITVKSETIKNYIEERSVYVDETSVEDTVE